MAVATIRGNTSRIAVPAAEKNISNVFYEGKQAEKEEEGDGQNSPKFDLEARDVQEGQQKSRRKKNKKKKNKPEAGQILQAPSSMISVTGTFGQVRWKR